MLWNRVYGKETINCNAIRQKAPLKTIRTGVLLFKLESQPEVQNALALETIVFVYGEA